jgi:MoxR-like ATPase
MDAATSPGELATLLRSVDYVPDEGVSTVAHLALALNRPLLLEGEPGTGKTALATSLAEAFGIPLIRLQCYEGIDAQTALYDWDFARQILHLHSVRAAQSDADVGRVEGELYTERFLLARPILRALKESPAVLLIDEIDRADDEFEALLLEVLSEYQVSIPEFGTVRAEVPPIVVLTSNRTRDLHDALKRRCLYHWIDHPDLEREVEILSVRLPEVGRRLATRIVEIVQRLRQEKRLLKPPGVAETIDWASAVHELGSDDLDLETATLTLGALSKSREDVEYLRATLETQLGN